MHRCNECGHHHGQGHAWLPCKAIVETDDHGSIARCHCQPVNHHELKEAA